MRLLVLFQCVGWRKREREREHHYTKQKKEKSKSEPEPHIHDKQVILKSTERSVYILGFFFECVKSDN